MKTDMERKRKLFLAKTAVILGIVPVLIWAHEYGSDAGYCNVPKESGTCAQAGCHVGTANASTNKGSIAVTFPNGATYTPGVKQHLTVTISDPATTQRAWGFQLTARTASNSATLAGTFASTDALTTLMCASASLGQELEVDYTATLAQTCPVSLPLQYIEQSLTGYQSSLGHTGSYTFQFDWTPPATNVGNITIYVAANAANGDLTVNGDHIYTTTYTLTPAAAGSTPTVTYGTYFGGTGDTNSALAVAVDPSGNVVVAGLTSSQTLPGTATAFQPLKATGFPNNRDVFIAKFDPSGRTLLWASFLGGDGDESPTALAVDPTGSVYVVGTTTSSTFPVTSGAYVRSQRQGLTNGFATKISADGRTLLYSTYLLGTPAALAVSSSGEAYIAGAFSSGNGVDLLYLNATGTGLVSSTYLGGAGFNGSTTTSLAVSPQGNIYIAGFTAAVNVMTTPNAFQPQYSNSATGGPCPLECNNGFVIEVNSTGAQVVYGTYFGPRYSDTKVNSIAIATDGSVYFSGYTNTTTIQATAGAFLTKPDYGFVAKLTPGSSVMDSFSYLPNYFSPFLEVGNQPEAAYVVFWTPSVGPTQGIEVAELNVPTLALTSSLNLTIPFPGFAAFAAAFAPPHSLWLAGFCESPCSLGNLVSSNAFQNTPQNPSSSAVLIRVTDLPSVPQLTVGVSHIGNFTQGQSGAAYTITVQNTGGGASTGIVTVTDALPAGLTAATMGGVGWSCVVSSATCTRLDSLSAVSAYPAITLTLNVALGTASPVVNQVNVTGSGSAAASATDSTTILAPFADVSPTDAFLPAINLLREYSITSGCDNSPLQPKYCPTDNITRGQMAVFVVRSITGGDNFSYTQAPYFTDVPSSHPFFQWIQKLRDLGVTSSCGSTPAGQLYCPNDPVTRGQMAVFIIRDRFGSATVFNYSPTPLFTDVLPANTFFAWIQKLKQLGITSSCGSNAAGQQYCPDDPVTREQMAVFLMRGAFNQLLLAGAPVIVSVSPAAEPRGYSTTVTLTGQNTNWVNGTTQVSTGPGITASNVLVTSPTTLTAQLVVAASAVAGPYSLTAITGSEEATLPNGFTVQ